MRPILGRARARAPPVRQADDAARPADLRRRRARRGRQRHAARRARRARAPHHGGADGRRAGVRRSQGARGALPPRPAERTARGAQGRDRPPPQAARRGPRRGAGMTPADAGTLAVTPQELRRQVSRLKAVPTLPRLLERVIAILEDPEVNFESVAEVVEVDQALASQILRLANSAFYSRQGAVSRVSQALVMLGAVVTRSVVLSSSVLDLREVSLRGFWEHSLGCATAAGAIAKVTGKANPEEAAAAGLLHDLGKVVLCKQLPEAFAYILERAEVE